MKTSSAYLTVAQIERWRARGYVVEVNADSEFVDIHKPVEQEYMERREDELA